MRYHYDWEFEENGETIIPISVGIVADDGRELYLINKDYMQTVFDLEPYYWRERHSSVISEWLSKNVLDNISQEDVYNYGVAEENMGFHIQTFISAAGRYKSRNEVELWGYYSAYDHVALAQCFGPMINLPIPIPLYTNELMTIRNGRDWPERPVELAEHHALNDAKYQKLIYESWSQ